MSRPRSVPIRRPYALLAALLGATALVLAALPVIALYAPADRVLGVSQKIFYFHVGSAFAMLLGLSLGSVFSLADLLGPDDRLDALARACLETGVVFGAIVLTTGPLWARKAWGAYWTWEPRLTLSLLVELLAVCVLAVRSLAPDSDGARRAGAAMAVMAAPAAYLIHVAVKLWGGNHPQVIQGGGGGIRSAEMRVAFWLSVAALLAFSGVMMALRYRGLRLSRRAADLRLRLSALSLRRLRGPGAAATLLAAILASSFGFVPIPARAGPATLAVPAAPAVPEAPRATEAPASRDLSRYKEDEVSGGALVVAAYMALWVLIALFVGRALWVQSAAEAEIKDLDERLELLEEGTDREGQP